MGAVKKPRNLAKLSFVEKVEAALKSAVAKVIEENKRLGLPLIIWRDGKVVHVPPEELEVRESKSEYRVSGKRKR
jgi:hypothetical protein